MTDSNANLSWSDIGHISLPASGVVRVVLLQHAHDALVAVLAVRLGWEENVEIV